MVGLDIFFLAFISGASMNPQGHWLQLFSLPSLAVCGSIGPQHLLEVLLLLF
jgi:hypothetical protein